MVREIPHPMPVQMRDTVNIVLREKDLVGVSDNARFLIRRLVSDAYALGFFDGRLDESHNDSTDRAIARNRGETL